MQVLCDSPDIDKFKKLDVNERHQLFLRFPDLVVGREESLFTQLDKKNKPVMKETAVFSDDVSKVVLLRRRQMVEPYPDTGSSVPDLTER